MCRLRCFLLGYLIVWAGFLGRGHIAAMDIADHWAAHHDDAVDVDHWSAALFLAAGLYQFSPLKEVCLAYCRTPDSFILSEWRDGALGGAIMGLRHGLFCMGCCAALMVLLFAVAVMDLRWVAALTVAGDRREAPAGGDFLA